MEQALVLVLCLGAVCGAPSLANKNGKTRDVDFLMPEVQPKYPDTYLCTPMKMTKTAEYIGDYMYLFPAEKCNVTPSLSEGDIIFSAGNKMDVGAEKSIYVISLLNVGFRPHANMAIAHHILLYGCDTPGSSNKDVWNCGEMQGGGDQKYESHPVCAGGQKILYAWAMDAPSLKLPQGVGFKVGANTGINYLVLQVHYKDVTTFLPPHNEIDKSGITMTITEEPQRRAGVYLLGTSGNIPKHSVTYMETECPYTDNYEIHPFAFRTHGHGLAKVISGYRIRNGQWTEIGRKSPQLPQMFYNATTPGLTIRRGDILAARCTMQNDLDHDVAIGSTQNDEMCNFYVMYYTESRDKIMSNTYCFSQGPPFYYWKNDLRMTPAIKNIPKTASVIPGEKTPLKQTAEAPMYEDPDYQGGLDAVEDVKGWDMNMDPDSLKEEELARLMLYLQERGPRAYDDEDDYY